MLFAAGCATSISRRMAWPSFVRTIPPIGSSSIFSMALGPRHERIISATVLAAAILESWALRPDNLVSQCSAGVEWILPSYRSGVPQTGCSPLALVPASSKTGRKAEIRRDQSEGCDEGAADIFLSAGSVLATHAAKHSEHQKCQPQSVWRSHIQGSAWDHWLADPTPHASALWVNQVQSHPVRICPTQYRSNTLPVHVHSTSYMSSLLPPPTLEWTRSDSLCMITSCLLNVPVSFSWKPYWMR